MERTNKLLVSKNMKNKLLYKIKCKGNRVLVTLVAICFLSLNPTVALIGAPIGSYAIAQMMQQKKVTIDIKNKSLDFILDEVRKQTGLNFMLKTDPNDKSIANLSLKVKNESVENVLKMLLTTTNYTYQINDDMIAIVRKKDSKPLSKRAVVNGSVIDEDKNALAGVTILVKGTTKGAITDMGGKFSLEAKEGDELELSYVGMIPLSYTLKEKDQSLQLMLKKDNVAIEDVVVVGYGTMKRSDVTGSISSVDSRILEESSASDVGSIIQGQVAGLNILTGSGSPGEDVMMQIRGVSSLSGETSPLIILDDIPMPPSFSLNSINPSDVQSIDVLKGASSAAIYGSRAAAGVIVITTKKGSRNSKPSINYSFNYGIRQLLSDINVLNTDEFKLLLLEATKNSAYEAGYPNLDGYNYYKTFTQPGFFGEVNTPWMKLLMQPAHAQKHDISVRGGGASSSYSFSYGLSDETGMLVNTFNRRHTYSVNLNNDINKYIKTGVMIRGDMSKRGKTEDFKVAAEARPDIRCYNDDGSYYLHTYLYQGDLRFEANPMIEAKESENVSKNLGLNIAAFIEGQIINGLRYKVQYSYSLNDREDREFSPSETFLGSGGYAGKKGSLTERKNKSEKQEFEARLFYAKRIKKHDFDITAVVTMTDEERFNHSITFTDFPDDKVQNAIYQGINFKSQYGNDYGSILLSGVGRANYKYNDRYLFTASIRADGSSRFSPENRWSYFPSVAVGWIVTNEPFLKNGKVLTFLKLRASAGMVGMGYVDEYGWRTLGGSAEYLNKPAVVPISIGNDELKWESSMAYDLGIDFAFMKNGIISGTIGVYEKKTRDLLYDFTLSPGIGLPNTKVNFASIQNRGIEFNLNVKIFNKRSFSWEVAGNISKNLNKITGLNSRYVSSPGSPSLNSTVIEEGRSLGLFFGYKSDGIFQTWEEIERYEALNPDMPYQKKFSSDLLSPGDIKLRDLSGDGYVNFTTNCHEDKTVLGSSLPDFTGGVSTRLFYRGFTFSMQGTFSYGNMKSWDAESKQFTFNPSRPKNLLDLSLNRWTPENPTNQYPKVKLNGTNYGMTDFWLHDASFFKIQNISLGYRLDQKLTSKSRIFDSIEVFSSINNAFVFTKYPGPNPESYSSTNRIAGAAIDFTAYPQARTYNFGIKVTIK